MATISELAAMDATLRRMADRCARRRFDFKVAMVLARLAEFPEGCVGYQELRQASGIGPVGGEWKKLIDRIVSEKAIVVSTDPGDGRRRLVTITYVGLAIVERLARALQHHGEKEQLNAEALLADHD